MSFCPSCGASNTDDARFCNKCGSAITAGAPASTVPLTPPPMSTGGTSSVTLAGIGIQSPRKTWAVLGIGALVFLGLGAGLAFVGMRSSGTATTASAETTTGSSDASGDALPDGVDVPEDDFVMSGGARVVKRGASAGGTPLPSTTTTPPSTTTGGSTPSHTTGGTTPPHSTTGGTTHTTGGTTPSHTTGSTDHAPSTGGTGGTSGSTPPPGSSVDWDSLSGTVADPSEEPDYQMQMYSTQVRRFIRQYLLPSATSCFEHASATQRDSVHGTVAIGFDIDARGHAQGATIDRNTTGIDTLAHCLQSNVSSWQLPPPPADTAPIQMQMPFTR